MCAVAEPSSVNVAPHLSHLNVWDLPEDRLKTLQEINKLSKDQWKKVRTVIDDECSAYNELGRKFYNAAMFLIFLGIGFVIAPFSFAVALVVGTLGIVLQAWQAYLATKLGPRITKRAQDALRANQPREPIVNSSKTYSAPTGGPPKGAYLRIAFHPT
jgi:hypothetical protein